MSETIDDRLRAIEDKMAIYALISGFGPAVESFSNDDAIAMWLADGSYEVDKVGSFHGPDGLNDLLTGDFHLAAMRQGGAHVLSMPYVRMAKDRAVATGYAQLFVTDGAIHQAIRTVASRWELRKTADGWRVARRINAVFDESNSARELIGRRNELPGDHAPARDEA
jgi:hypothetical protein